MFKKIMDWFKGLIIPALGDFFKAVFTKAKQEAISALKDIAVQTVLSLADTDLSNEEKRKAAFSKIKNYAVTRGIEAKDSTINLLLEMAVASLKG
jgi:hypothetical protein